MSSANETQHALYMFARTFQRYKHESFLNLKTFSDGLPFASMLSSIKYFASTLEQLNQSPEKWTQKLSNLKKLITKMENYVEAQSQKILKINDIELVQVAKNSSQQQTLKFFEVVIAVLMQTPQKQDYIQRIMGLDQRSQQALVIIVQNAMEYRISEQQKTSKSQQLQQLSNLQNENQILTQQINQLCQQNESLQKQNSDLKQKIHEYQEEVEKARNLNIQMYMTNKGNQSQKQNSLIQTLKKKMIQMSRQHELEITKLNEEAYHLKSKLIHYKEIQQQLIQRNKLIQDKIKGEAIQIETQKKRIEKIIEQKQLKIKKLQYQLEISKNKIRQLSEDIEVNDLNLRMELQKKEVRFKQLQKQVKNRLIQPSPQLNAASSKKILSSQQNKSPGKQQQNEQQMQYLKIQVQKLRVSNRELQRQNLKMKKRSEKIVSVESQKKKLEKIILDVSKCRDSEIQMLVVSLYDLRNQNIRMHEIIQQLKYKQQSKFD